MKSILIDRWSVFIPHPSGVFAPVNEFVAVLCGHVYHHPQSHLFPDGSSVTTEALVCLDTGFGIAESVRRIYSLGQVDPQFEERLNQTGSTLLYYENAIKRAYQHSRKVLPFRRKD